MNEIIGYLNREYGYNGYLPIEKGTPIYMLDKNRCYFLMQTLKGEMHRQIFITETLKPHIIFTNA
jgi:hypothetical protein